MRGQRGWADAPTEQAHAFAMSAPVLPISDDKCAMEPPLIVFGSSAAALPRASPPGFLRGQTQLRS